MKEKNQFFARTYRTTTFILSSGVDGALSDDLAAIFSNDSASLLRLKLDKKNYSMKFSESQLNYVFFCSPQITSIERLELLTMAMNFYQTCSLMIALIDQMKCVRDEWIYLKFIIH